MNLVISPYFATTLAWIWSYSAPSRTLAAAAWAEVPCFGTPRALQGYTVTADLFASRFASPDAELVEKSSVWASISTTQTGVATGVPSRRYEVKSTYLSSEKATSKA